MNKTLLLSSLLITTLFARENPFFSLSEGIALPVSSEKNTNKPPLTSMTYNFPNNSRLLKEVSFTFQNVDGSFETRKLEIDQSIDWRAPLVLSQSNIRSSPSTTKEKSSNVNNELIQFIASGNKTSLIAKEPMIRQFTLTDPDSVVVDFKHSGAFESYIALDGHHICNVSKTDQGASVICK